MLGREANGKRGIPTDHELSVLLAVVTHGGVKVAAHELGLSAHTVRTYLDRLRNKSGCSTLAQILLWAQTQSTAVRLKLPKSFEASEEGSTPSSLAPWPGVSEAQWTDIAPHLPAERKGPGRHRLDRRAILNGILYKLRTGCSWDQLPPEFGNRSTCSRCYREWRSDGVWEVIWKQFYATLSPSEKREWGLLLLEKGWVPGIPVRGVHGEEFPSGAGPVPS